MIYILIVIILIILMYFTINNQYVSLNNKNLEAWSNIKVYLQKRLDLIPNLVNIVKEYEKHESTTLQKVIEARTKLINIDISNIENIKKISEYENQLTNALRHISMLSEAYPELKANTQFTNLTTELSNIENDVLDSRRYYNATARNLNTFTEKLPNSLFSSLIRYRKASYFEDNIDKDYEVKVEF